MLIGTNRYIVAGSIVKVNLKGHYRRDFAADLVKTVLKTL